MHIRIRNQQIKIIKVELKHNYKPYSRIKNTTKIKFRSHKPVIKQKKMEIIVLQK